MTSIFRKSASILIAIQIVFSSAAVNGQEPGGAEILWDNYGIPHVFGRNISEMYYGFGWAQMHNHANLLLRLYGQARGRAAEYWGGGYLKQDQQIRLFDIATIAHTAYQHQDPTYKRFLDAFVRGINVYAQRHPEAISAENKQVLPVVPEDVIAHGIRVVYLKFMAEEDLGAVNQYSRPGSNAYAISPARSTSGSALLLANPHLPWGDLYTFFEAHLQAPGFNAYGASLVGFPVLNIAFNQHLGWTHTVNVIDVTDRYELTLKGDGYELDGAVVPFDKRSEKIKIRQDNGVYTEQKLEMVYSKHGPIVARQGDKAYAIRIAGLDNASLFFQWHLMAKANNWGEFDHALRLMQLPMFNVVYADQGGNILYLFDGNVPDRIEGDWKFWHGMVDGRYSKYIWKKTLGYNSLPRVFDPHSGFVQNANDPPWNCTYPAMLKPADFPSYLSSKEDLQWRPQRAINMIRNDHAISFEELIAYKQNTGMEVADRFLKDLLSAAAKYPDSLVDKAAMVLKQWDGATDSGSKGAVLFAAWFDKVREGLFLKGWDQTDPVTTPSGFRDYQMAATLLKAAAEEVTKEYGRLDIAWGDVFRFRADGVDYPANGGNGKYGIFRTFYFRRDKDRKYRAVAGDSYVAVTEFGKKIRAKVLLSYGNSSQSGTRHATDQLLLLSRKKLRDAWLTRNEILEHLEEKETINMQYEKRR